MTAPDEHCVDCPACVAAAKELEVAAGTRCSLCFNPIEAWDERAEKSLCGNCMTRVPAVGLGAKYGRGRQ